MTRAELILKLLQTCHLNVPERRKLDPPGISFVEILDVIHDVHVREQRVSSGHVTLERQDAGGYRLYYLAYDPQLGDLVNDWGGPSIPTTRDYPTMISATVAFMVLIGATRGLDGIEISGVPRGDA